VGAKQNKCCCCPACTVNPDQCCTCIPTTICVTLEPYGSDPVSIELDWDSDGKQFAGSIGGHDLLFYFERDEYTDECCFKLRSDSLGFPEGYEHCFVVGDDIDCETLTASLDTDDGLLTIEAVERITPETCNTCRCLCECLCVTVTQTLDETITCTGKACWDYAQQAYVGTVICNDYEETEREVTIKIGPKGLYCEDTYPESDYDDCDPYDETCVIVLSVPSLGIEDEWQELTEPCEERNLDYSWTLEPYGFGEVGITIRCAICNEDCNRLLTECQCEEDGELFNIPRTLTADIHFITGTPPDPPSCDEHCIVTIVAESILGEIIWHTPCIGFACVDCHFCGFPVNMMLMICRPPDPNDLSFSGYNAPNNEVLGVQYLISLKCDPFEAVWGSADTPTGFDPDGFGWRVVVTE
jgi:hypothetical protein